MDIQSLATEIRWSADLFIKSLSAFPEDKINVIPFSKSWTAGQVANHMIKATDGLPDQVTKPAERKPDQQVELIKSIFLDFSTKLPAPKFIIPDDGPFQKEELLFDLAKNRDNNINIISSKDMTQLCLALELSQMGFLTRYEWMKLMSFHMQRHTHQLNKIAEKFAGVGAQSI